MKTIIDSEINKVYLNKKLHTEGALRQRLISFGLLKGCKIKCIAVTNFKGTYEIEVGKMKIALRKEELEKVEII